jgi:hypothetical protein
MPGFTSAAAGLPMTRSQASGRGSPPQPAVGEGDDRGDRDDEYIADLLIRMWSLASGRTLRSDIRPEQLSSEELISFWADDLTAAASGRHAGPAIRCAPQAQLVVDPPPDRLTGRE